jgi:hypothetical protein
MYSDLECDYINPIDLCNRLNMYIVPEAGVHAFLTILFLINGYWVPLILNLPLLAWNAKKYVYPSFAGSRTILTCNTAFPYYETMLTNVTTGSSRTSTCLTPRRSSGSSTCTRRSLSSSLVSTF